MKKSQEENYYVKNKDKLMKLVLEIINNPQIAKKVLLKHVDQATFERLSEEWIQEFEGLIPQIPYIGGEKNRLTFFLVNGVMSFGFYSVLKRHGKDTREIGHMIYEITRNYYETLSKWRKKIARRMYYSNKIQSRFKKSSEERAQLNYPGDFQSVFVEGDGRNLVWGFDYTECANAKFLKSQNALKILPYLCVADYAMFRALGIGFKRTQTIGSGGNVCDFRFMRNYQTPEGWPPEKLEEFKMYLAKKH